jgi:hypothetical protein
MPFQFGTAPDNYDNEARMLGPIADPVNASTSAVARAEYGHR